MYQFTQLFTEMNANAPRKSYCWKGLAAGFFAGWLPAWGISHWMNGGGWIFALSWILMIPAGYGIGKLIKK